MLLDTVKSGPDVKHLRGEARVSVALSGELLGAGGRMACRIIDLSRSGVCIEAERPQPRGTRVSIRRGTLDAAGEITWTRGRRAGVRFDQPIRATELFLQLSDSRAEAQAASAPPLSPGATPPSPSR